MGRTVTLRRRSEAEASKDERSWRATCEPTLRPVQHEFRIREVGQPRAMRALEIFATAPLGINTDKAGDVLVGIDEHRDLAEPQQQPADAAGASGVFGGAAAVDQLHRRRCDETT